MKATAKTLRIAALLLAALLLLCGCGKTAQPAETAAEPETTAHAPITEASATAPASTAPSESAPAQSTEPDAPETEPETAPAPEAHSDTLVVFFSATGTTKGVAERIAKVTNADLYEIIPVEPYTEADLDWHDSDSRTTHEQNDKSARPEIAGERLSMDGYTTIYVGFPIWWGEEPRIMDTFVESYDFTGKTVIPFCTSGGSGIGRSGPNMEALAGTGTWLDGTRHNAGISEEELQNWINGLK